MDQLSLTAMFTVIALYRQGDSNVTAVMALPAVPQTARSQKSNVTSRRISLCHCCVKNKRGDAIGVGGDESDEALA
jgi:hypothetical protein